MERKVIVKNSDGRVENFELQNPHWEFAMDRRPHVDSFCIRFSLPVRLRQVDAVAEERLIVQTVLRHPTTINLFGTRKMQVARDTALPPLHDSLDDPKGFYIRRYDSDALVLIPQRMREHRRSNNRKPWSTAGLSLPPRQTQDPDAPGTEVWERITVSRPGISEDGLSAIVAITRGDWAEAGFTVYLEKTGGIWKVVGEAGVWVV